MNRRAIAASVGVQYIGRAVGLVFSLFSVGLLTRYLSVAAYGDYTTAFAIAGLIVTFSDFGFFWSTIQNLNGKNGSMDAVREVLGIRVLLTLVLIAASLLVVWAGNFPHTVKVGYSILIVFVFNSSLNNIFVALYQAEYRMGWPTFMDLVSRAVNLAFIIIGSVKGYGLQWFIIGGSLASAANLILNWIPLTKRHGLLLPRIRNIAWRKYYESVFLVGMMALFSALYNKIDIVILSWAKGSVDIGIYGVAQKVVELTIMFQALLVSALFPLLITRLQESEARFLKLTRQTFLMLAVVGIPIGIFGPLLSTFLVRVVSGQKFIDASTVVYGGHAITAPMILTVLLVFVAISYVRAAFTTSLLASGDVKQLLIANIVATIVNIAFNILLVPTYSYLAAAIITVLTEVILTIITFYYFFRRFPFSFPWKEVVVIIAATIPGSLCLYALPVLPTVVSGLIAVIIYTGILFTFLPQLRSLLFEFREKRASAV